MPRGRRSNSLLRACTMMQIIAMTMGVVLLKAMIRGAHVHYGRSCRNATIWRIPVFKLSKTRGSVVALEELLAWGMSIGTTGWPAKRPIHSIPRKTMALLTAVLCVVLRPAIRSIRRRRVRRTDLLLLNGSSVRWTHVPIAGNGSGRIISIGRLGLQMRRG